MGERGLYFFEYAGYGGMCFVVRADSEAEAVDKLTEKLSLEPDLSDSGVRLYVAVRYKLEFVDDIAETQYLGE